MARPEKRCRTSDSLVLSGLPFHTTPDGLESRARSTVRARSGASPGTLSLGVLAL